MNSPDRTRTVSMSMIVQGRLAVHWDKRGQYDLLNRSDSVKLTRSIRPQSKAPTGRSSLSPGQRPGDAPREFESPERAHEAITQSAPRIATSKGACATNDAGPCSLWSQRPYRAEAKIAIAVPQGVALGWRSIAPAGRRIQPTTESRDTIRFTSP